ncbi:MAG: Na+/H+ antiporter [Bacteroidetes bacterium]|nr:Na+/H+ antiporter [Bacteroidota bacterium]
MHLENITVILLLLAVVTALAEVADRVKVPYPVLLVLAGIGISLIPNLPAVQMSPEVMFLIFLPPALYSSAWTTSWPDFKSNIRSISLLAVGCVLFTTTVVAAAAHYVIPGFGWPESFVLGAIISPPDAVAAAAATVGLKVPKRLITILEGESLVNDATGLIAMRYAIAATASGTFIFWLAGINFIYVAAVGIIIGFIVGQIFFWLRRITPDNPTTDTTMTFIAPYVAYVVAEQIHVSGVLAVVTCGLFLSQRSSQIFKHEARMQAWATWDTVIFILNGLIFVLIGLQLPQILSHISDHSFTTLLWYGFVVSMATIVSRIVWVYPGAYLPRFFSKRIRAREPRPPARNVFIVAWSGMRGVVSLAAALALPIVFADGTAFPNRDLIIFLTFAVIFSTLVFQGMTLPALIKRLGIQPDVSTKEVEDKARYEMATSIIEHIEENYSLGVDDGILNKIKLKYELRIQRLKQDQGDGKLSEQQINQFMQIQHALIKQERVFLEQMRKKGELGDEALRKIERELDLEESRLMLELEEEK